MSKKFGKKKKNERENSFEKSVKDVLKIVVCNFPWPFPSFFSLGVAMCTKKNLVGPDLSKKNGV